MELTKVERDALDLARQAAIDSDDNWPKECEAIFIAGLRAGMERAAKICMECYGWGEGMGGFSRDGDKAIQHCAKCIRAAAKE